MMFYPMFYFDPTYVLILIGVVISMAASAKLNSTYQRYSAVRSMCGMTGADAAKRLLANQGHRLRAVTYHAPKPGSQTAGQ